MRILLLTAGSRGDVEPFLALARRGVRDGHEVRLGVTREFVALAETSGVDVVPLDGDYQALVEAQGVSAWAAMRAYRSTIGPMMAAILRSAVAAALDHRPDVIVYHPKILSAPLAAARLGVPAVIGETVPVVTPTRAFPAPGVGPADLGPLNRLTYKAGAGAAAMFRGVLGELRAELGLTAKGAVPGPVRSLVMVSPSLLPRPADWPETTVLTGQWHEPPAETAAIDPELDAFLADGEPVYVGFGSMASGDPVARARAIIPAIRAAGRRTLVVTGWGGIAVPPELLGGDVLVRDSVAHGTVLPRCSLAIHHGGAGTVHAVVRAGVPSVVVPFLADQPFWGRLLHRRGLGAEPVPSGRVTRQRMDAALAGAPSRDAVQPVAERLRAEDGCGVALEVLRSLA
jgi:sterol 3beta-glucosyltransferase